MLKAETRLDPPTLRWKVHGANHLTTAPPILVLVYKNIFYKDRDIWGTEENRPPSRFQISPLDSANYFACVCAYVASENQLIVSCLVIAATNM